MQFDFRPGSARSLHARRSVTVSGWLTVALAAGAMSVGACSSLNSGSGNQGTGGKVDSGSGSGGATGSGGMVSSMGGSSTGGSGAGGSSVDAAVDAPANDSSTTDTPLPCGAGNDCCPNDPLKTEPGMCGCGVPDSAIDTDGDGVPDCIDECVNDSSKFTAGICGCGIPDVNTDDTDGDGTPDCLDECPKDATRTKHGPCGCGVPDNTPLCLAHRYQFNDVTPADGGVSDGGADAGTGSANPPGTVIHDSVGTADGVAVRATANGSGSITLNNPAPGTDPSTDQYIQLPANLISSLGNNATFETWVTWNGGAVWQRIFDFGGNNNPIAGMKGVGSFFIFVTPAGGIAPNGVFVSFVTLGNAVNEISAPTALAAGTMQHVAVVVNDTTADGGAPTMTLYVNGLPVLSSPLANTLSSLPDVNNWLGRSQFPDPSFAGTYHEFRIYSTARTADQVKASFDMGPDALPPN
jgi:hypothetical protein